MSDKKKKAMAVKVNFDVKLGAVKYHTAGCKCLRGSEFETPTLNELPMDKLVLNDL